MPKRPLVTEGDRTEHPTVAEPDRFAGLTDQPVLATGGGLEMPRLGFGTWQLHGGECQRMVEAALDLGHRHVDTAQTYGNEEAVGAALKASGLDPGEVFVTTKLADEHHEPDAVRSSLERSIERLGVERVDLALVHWPVDWDRMGATLAALAMAHAGGLCRHIGVSNFTVEQLDEVVDQAPLEALQVECHPYLAQERLRRWCCDHDLAFVAYSPLARGEVVGDETLADVGRRHDAEPSQVALAWLLALPSVAAIPRTSALDHLRSNWAARSIALDDGDMERIATLDRGHRTVDPQRAPWNRGHAG